MEVGIRRRKPSAADWSVQQVNSEVSNVTVKNHYISRARLKRSAMTSVVLCAFTMSSLTELQSPLPTRCPVWILTAFSVSTVTLIGVHILALVISNFLLPTLEYITLRRFNNANPSVIPNAFFDSPTTQRHVEIAWTFTTVIGMFLYLVQIMLLCWVKFYDVCIAACVAGSIAVAPFMVMFVGFCVFFNRELLIFDYEMRREDLKEVERLKDELDLISIKIN